MSGTARILAAVVLAAAGLRLWGIGFGLPHPMTRPDEEFLIGKAMGFFSGDFNPHFFEWPSLYFYVVHAVLRVVYGVGYLTGVYRDTNEFVQISAADPAWIYLTLRSMSAAAGVATVVVVHGICRVLLDRRTASIAAALLAVAYLHVRDSHFGVLDVPLTLLIAIAIRFLATAWVSSRPGLSLALAGTAAGLASSVKYNAAALLVPCAATVCLKVFYERPDRRGNVLLGGLACIALFAAAFLAGSPYVLLDYEAFREGIDAQVTRLTGGHGIAIANVWTQHLTFSLWYGVGGPVLLAAGFGLVALAQRNWRVAVLLSAFPVAYFAVIGTAFHPSARRAARRRRRGVRRDSHAP